MLRVTVLLLIFLNLAYLAWSQGALRAYGLGPAAQSETERLSQQLHPEQVRLLTNEQAQEAEVTARRQRCLQAGPLAEKQLILLLKALQPWPVGSWRLEPTQAPPRWRVVLGPLDTLALARTKQELKDKGIGSQELRLPGLAVGLSLGSFATQALADVALEDFTRRSVRAARVLQDAEPVRGTRLVLPLMNESLRPRLDELQPALDGIPLAPCQP